MSSRGEVRRELRHGSYCDLLPFSTVLAPGLVLILKLAHISGETHRGFVPHQPYY